MFHLSEEIKNWIKQVRKNPAYEDGDIAEFESHLLDHIRELQLQGLSEQEAFEKAISEFGSIDSVADEIYKNKTIKRDPTPPWKKSPVYTGLFANYFKIALRVIKRNPIYTFINIFGLTTGFLCCTIILGYLFHLNSFDNFHVNASDIYRLNKEAQTTIGGTELHSLSSGAIGPQLKQDFPEIKSFVRLRPWYSDVVLENEHKRISVENFILADSTFFKVFDFNLLKGNPNNALKNPLSIILSEEVAEHLFGSEDPIGKFVTGLNGLSYTVTGIVEQVPENSHLEYDVLVSWTSTGPSALNFGFLNEWLNQSVYTYLLLNEGVNSDEIESSFGSFLETHFQKKADEYALYLQPLNDIYLHSQNVKFNDVFRTGDEKNLYVFLVIAFLVLIVAGINFLNINTAKSLERVQEIGVRKVLGAEKLQLGIQFLGEALLISGFAVVVAAVMYFVLMPFFNWPYLPDVIQYVTEPITLMLLLIGMGLVVGLVSGIYPSVILASHKPSDSLRGTVLPGGRSKGMMQKNLVILQFTFAAALVVCSFIVNRQLEHVNDIDPGFEKDQVLVIPVLDDAVKQNGETFLDELLGYSGFSTGTSSNTVPGMNFFEYDIVPEGPSKFTTRVKVLKVGNQNFIDTYKIQLSEGRFFMDSLRTDFSHKIVINQALANSLDWQDPIGKKLTIEGEIKNGEVIGVVKNFSIGSLYDEIPPLAMVLVDNWNFISLKTDAGNIDSSLKYAEEVWSNFKTSRPFEYYFLSNRLNSFYQEEYQMHQIMTLFTGFVIIVACLGLFALSTFTVKRREKEISIRKVFGSSATVIVVLLSKDFLKLVMVGFLISTPLSYWLVNKWLDEFTYRISVGFSVYLITASILLILAMAVISGQSLIAARKNPAITLKNT